MRLPTLNVAPDGSNCRVPPFLDELAQFLPRLSFCHHFHLPQHLLIYHSPASPLQFRDDVRDVRFLHKTASLLDRTDDQKPVNGTCKVAFRNVPSLFAEQCEPESMNRFLH